MMYRDEAGLVADFHSLRHSCGSWLLDAGVDIKTPIRAWRISWRILVAKAEMEGDRWTENPSYIQGRDGDKPLQNKGFSNGEGEIRTPIYREYYSLSH
jgi:hypothetical protein